MGECVLVFDKRQTEKEINALSPTLSHQRFHSPAATSVHHFLKEAIWLPLWYSGVMKIFQRCNIQIPYSQQLYFPRQEKLHLIIGDEAWLSVRCQEENWLFANLDYNSWAQNNQSLNLFGFQADLPAPLHSGSKSTWSVVCPSRKSREIDSFQADHPITDLI